MVDGLLHKASLPLAGFNLFAYHRATGVRKSILEFFCDMDVGSLLRLSISKRIGQERFDLWFAQVNIVANDGGVCLECPRQFTIDWLRNNFREEIRAACQEILEATCELQFRLCKTDEFNRESLSTASNPASDDDSVGESDLYEVRSSAKQVAPAPRTWLTERRRFHKLESFVGGDSNRLALTAAQMVVNNPGSVSPLFLYGPSGVGKTHLLEGIWSALRRQSRKSRCVYLTAEQFTSYFIEALHGRGLPNFRRYYRGVDLLVIEDVQFFARKRATLDELQYTIDSLLRDGRQLALSSDRSPSQLTNLGNELSVRFSGGLVARLQLPDRVTRLEIVRRVANERGLSVPEPVVELIANHLTEDVRLLHGALNRLAAASQALGEPITRSLAVRTLEELFQSNRRVVALPDIAKAVSEVCGVEQDRLRSADKSRSVSEPRMLAMWLARQYTRAPLSEIGEFFGGRSHSTVISANKKVKTWVESGHDLQSNRTAPSGIQDLIQQIELQMRAS